MIELQAKRFKLNFLLKLSDLKPNFTLTLDYLNPALKNPGLDSKLIGPMGKTRPGCEVLFKKTISSWGLALGFQNVLK